MRNLPEHRAVLAAGWEIAEDGWQLESRVGPKAAAFPRRTDC